MLYIPPDFSRLSAIREQDVRLQDSGHVPGSRVAPPGNRCHFKSSQYVDGISVLLPADANENDGRPISTRFVYAGRQQHTKIKMSKQAAALFLHSAKKQIANMDKPRPTRCEKHHRGS